MILTDRIQNMQINQSSQYVKQKKGIYDNRFFYNNKDSCLKLQ